LRSDVLGGFSLPESRQTHVQRLHEGLRESIQTSEIHLDILADLKRISSHITAVAYPILEGV
jgi:phosphate:Na+ symporter